MKIKLQAYVGMVLLISFLAACPVAPDTGFEAGIDDWMDHPTKTGTGITDDAGEELQNIRGVVGNTYTLKVKTPVAGTTYIWTATSGLEVTADSADSSEATLKIVKGLVYDEKVTVSEASKEVGTTYVTAGKYKVKSKKQLDGKYYRVEFIDNFNDMKFVKDNWITEWTAAGPGNLKRPYWRNDALGIEDNSLAMFIKRDPTGEKHYTTKNHTAAPNKTAYIAGGIHLKDTKTGEQRHSVKGYVEARIRMDKKSAHHWNAFWSYHAKPQADVGNDLEYEFDVVEYTHTGKVYAQTTHWWKGSRYIPSRSHHVAVKEGWKEWLVVGMLWTDDEIVYYQGDTADTMTETVRMKKDGTASKSEFNVNADELKLFKTDGQEFIPRFPQNWKFTTELGIFTDNADGPKIDAELDKVLRNSQDTMYVDYFVWYVPA